MFFYLALDIYETSIQVSVMEVIRFDLSVE